LAPPSAVVPFNYLSLVWAMILGFAVWGDVPTPGLAVGSAIVIASSLYILWRETVHRRHQAVPAQQRGSPSYTSGLRRACGYKANRRLSADSGHSWDRS